MLSKVFKMNLIVPEEDTLRMVINRIKQTLARVDASFVVLGFLLFL